MGRTPCSPHKALKKGPWTPDEDQRLVSYIQKNGHGSWRALPNLAGLNRCGKSCRLRWTNYLRPDIKRGKFSAEEEQTIVNLHSILGNKWSAISSHLPGRTDNEIKNFWNTHLKKKLIQMGIDPVTHRPRTDLMIMPGLPQLIALSSLTELLTLDGHLHPTLRPQYPHQEATRTANLQHHLQHLLLLLLPSGNNTMPTEELTTVTTPSLAPFPAQISQPQYLPDLQEVQPMSNGGGVETSPCMSILTAFGCQREEENSYNSRVVVDDPSSLLPSLADHVSDNHGDDCSINTSHGRSRMSTSWTDDHLFNATTAIDDPFISELA